MPRIKFIDKMAQGKLSRREMLPGAAAFGVGLTVLPNVARAEEPLTCLEWGSYDIADQFSTYVAKHGGTPISQSFRAE